VFLPGLNRMSMRTSWGVKGSLTSISRSFRSLTLSRTSAWRRRSTMQGQLRHTHTPGQAASSKNAKDSTFVMAVRACTGACRPTARRRSTDAILSAQCEEKGAAVFFSSTTQLLLKCTQWFRWRFIHIHILSQPASVLSQPAASMNMLAQSSFSGISIAS
jgi:hypothetical protein